MNTRSLASVKVTACRTRFNQSGESIVKRDSPKLGRPARLLAKSVDEWLTSIIIVAAPESCSGSCKVPTKGPPIKSDSPSCSDSPVSRIYAKFCLPSIVMIKARHRRLLAVALGAVLVLYPVIHPVLNPSALCACDAQALPLSGDVAALDALSLKRVFPLGLEDQSTFSNRREAKHKEIGADNLIGAQKAIPSRGITGRINTVYKTPARSWRMAEPGNVPVLSEARITNIHSLTGPDFGTVRIDLTPATNYVAKRIDPNQVVIRLIGATISPSLDQRIFTLGDAGLIRKIALSGKANRNAAREALVDVTIDIALNSDYSIRRLTDPSRIVIDLHSQACQARQRSTLEQVGEALQSLAHESLEAETVKTVARELPSTDSQDTEEWLVAEKRLVSSKVEERINFPYRIDNSKPAALPTTSDKTIHRINDDISSASAAIEPKRSDKFTKSIVIDAGHGGHDPGAISRNGILEKEIVLDIAQRLRAYIRARFPHVEVVLTRESDYFITLDERVKIANGRNADLFLSIHANASESPAASGVETYYSDPNDESSRPIYAAVEANMRLTGENATGLESAGLSAQTANFSIVNRLEKSEALARRLQTELVRGITSTSQPAAKDRGVKPAAFAVLLGTRMPSVLAEVSFLSNPREAEQLRSEQFRDRIAASLLSGLDEYLRDTSVEPAQIRK